MNYTKKDLNKAIEALPKEWEPSIEKHAQLKGHETFYLKKGVKCLAVVKTINSEGKVNIENIDMFKHTINIFVTSIINDIALACLNIENGERFKSIGDYKISYWVQKRMNGKILVSIGTNTFFIVGKNKGKIISKIRSNVLSSISEDKLSNILAVSESDFNEIKKVVEILDHIL